MRTGNAVKTGTLLTIALAVGLIPCPGYGDVLFQDNMNSSPCNRWTVYYGDCSSDAGCTVYYYTGQEDACGSVWGYAYREYEGDRCMVRTDVDTTGYTNLKLIFWYRNTGSGDPSVRAGVRQDGSWVWVTTAGYSDTWKQATVNLSGTITGIRFKLQGNGTRRLDCISITGDPACTPPVEITTHPSEVSACPGDTAMFGVTATGSNLTYQWQKDGSDLTDGGDISGATTPTLQIANTQPADNGNYRCVVTGDCGTETSNAAPLTVSSQPAITQQPESQEVCATETATFTVAATGTGSVTYQWQKDGSDLSDGGDISGATTATLQITNVEPADEGSYRCVVADNCGTVTSNAATLTVSYETVLFEETFSTNPFSSNRWRVEKDGADQSGTVNYSSSGGACGSPAGYVYRYYDGHREVIYNGSFTTAGYDNLVLTYWYKNDSGASVDAYVKRDGSWVQVASAGSAGSWTAKQVNLSGVVTGIYFKISGGSDEYRCLDCISIVGEPECTPQTVITQHPSDLGLCPGQTANFSVTATGGELTYQWQKDGSDLSDGGGISGATTPALQIINAQPADSGNYRCRVSGVCGTKTSNAALLAVSSAPTITQQPQPQEECLGNTATFTLTAVGAGTVTYRWQKDGSDLSDGGDVSGATTATLRIANVEPADEGNYRCLVTDDCGTTVSDDAFLTVWDECLGVSPSGHYVTYKGDTLLLIGDSGTQCVPQNANLDHRDWIDDCAARSIRAVHVWAFVAVRQKQDGSQIEDRWGYVIPDLVPWARRTSGSRAYDQRYRWNLRAFDEGPEGDMGHYWPRMRDLCSYAKSKDVIVGITVFTGWSKHDYSWVFHPLNVDNGGHLSDKDDAVIIASPGTEVWQQTWSDSWSNAKKTQWVWEQLSKKLIDELAPYGNVFFVFFDEHSYSEGNMGDHFLQFFKSRGAVWVDWSSRRSSVDWVMSSTFGGDDKNSNAVSGFNGSPVRPYLFLEGEPYMGSGVRTAIWTFAIGGGFYFFHADAGQETVTTGIMGYDPHVPGGDKGMYKRDWLGYASRLFNENLTDLDSMTPRNGLVSGGSSYCLADPGREYVVYSRSGSSFTVNLSAAAGKTLDCRFYNPQNGNFRSTFQRAGGSSAESFTKPNSNDWALHIVEQIPDDPPVIAEVTPDPEAVFIGVAYTKQLTLLQGTPPITWSVVQGPAGIEVDGNGLVSGWTPDAGEIGSPYTIEIEAGNAVGSDSESWEVWVKTDVDFDGDGDVDQEDFGHFQACLSGSGVAQGEPGCQDARLDGDEDVDQDDFAVLQACLSGANTPADPACAN